MVEDVLCSTTGQVKSDTVMSAARHRCDVFAEFEAAFPWR